MSNSSAQRAQLHSKIWQIADSLRGQVDGWDFKQYVLCTIFYRYLSENFARQANILKKRPNSGWYETEFAPTEEYSAEEYERVKEELVKKIGYFIAPEDLFCNVVKRIKAKQEPNLNVTISNIFKSIEQSAEGKEAEKDLKGLFADFDISGTKLGTTAEGRIERLADLLLGVEKIFEIDDFTQTNIDLFGDAYEFLISKYASNAGKSGGEFFTPQCVSNLLAKLALHGLENPYKFYDPACGSGSLLLQVRKNTGDVKGFYHGQEINGTTYNLCRMNMFLHDINYKDFDIRHGDTLINPQIPENYKDKGFDVIVSNPPYSIKWKGKDNASIINDPRFCNTALPPNDKADLAFVLHIVHNLAKNGRAAIVSFPGIFYRSGAEQKIRKYLVDENYVDAIIALPGNLFYGTSIEVNILILSKGRKADDKVQFIDVNDKEYYKAVTNNNILEDSHINKILDIYINKTEEKHLSTSVTREEIAKKNYNLAVPAYVEPRNLREHIDINVLDKELEELSNNINESLGKLRSILNQLK